MRWLYSEALKWTMDSVTKACTYYLCNIQGFPDTESRSNVPNFQRKRVENGKEGLFCNGGEEHSREEVEDSLKERLNDFQRNTTTFPLVNKQRMFGAWTGVQASPFSDLLDHVGLLNQ